MNTAQILGYPLLVISALELFLGLLLLKQNPRNSPVNKTTAGTAFAAAVWSLSAAFMYIEVSLGRDYLFFARFSWVGWFTVPTAIQTVFYLSDEQSRKARITGWILYPFWSVVLALSLFTDLIVTPGYIPIPYLNSPGPLELPLRTIGSLTAFWLIGELVRLRRRTTGYRRSQLGYYLYGTIIFGTGGAFIGGLLQVFTGRGLEPSLSAYFSLPWVMMIFYAITRHRLFDIRFVVSRTLFILVLSFCVSAFQFVIFKMLEPMVGAVATIFISVPVIGVIFFGTPLSKNVQQWINDLVLRGRYRYQQMLKDTATAMVTILDREELLRFAVERVRSGLGVTEVFLYVREAGGSYSSRHYGGIEQKADGCILPHNVIDHLWTTGQPIIRDELSTGPSGVDPGLVETVQRIGAELLLPLIAKGRLLGVLTLNERGNGEPFLQGDLEALQTLASHTAAALENAELFEEAVQARAHLRESENIFRTLAETTTAGIFIFRTDRFLYANKAGVRMSGYGIEELLFMSPWAVIHPEYRSITFERGRAILQGQQISPQSEFKFVTKAGIDRWAVSTSAVIELQGEPALITTLVDITDLKTAEEERARLYEENDKHLRERIAEQERFAIVLSATSEGFWTCGDDMRFTFVNDAYCAMTGYAREELMTMTISDVEAHEDGDSVSTRTSRIAQDGYGRFETRHRRKDGSYVDLEITVSRFKDENTFFSFGRDISERKRSERERDRMIAEKEKILKDLHDGIGGLTSNINLLAELAQKNNDLGEVRKSLATISELSRESLSEIRGFIQSLDARELSWQAVAAELRSMGNMIIVPHGIGFSIDTKVGDQSGSPSSIIAMSLFRIYKESLANVIKHAKATKVDVSFGVGEGTAILEIRDNGIGLDGKRGSGRGLLNMKSRSTEISGSLAVLSENGTCVRLEFPLP
ncbi:MAG: PAS domain S-box protein [Nitrospirota bacterium]